MKRPRNLLVAAFMIAVTAAVLVVPGAPVSAESSAALSIVPRKDYTIEAGKGVKDTMVIRNLDNEKALNLSLRVVDFTFTDDGGTPKLMLDKDAPQTTWSLKPFMKVPSTVSIPPKGSKSVNMSVDIPKNQGAGSFYSAIVYSSGASDGGNVGLSASGVTLVFTTIPGDVNEALSLEKFGMYHPTKNRYTFATIKKPKAIAFTLKNSGNVVESPVGNITLKHILGKTQMIDDVNPNKSLALIGQTRLFTPCIKLQSSEVDFEGSRSEATTCAEPDLWPGLYTAELNLMYGQNGNLTQDIAGKAMFWYLPWWFIAISLAVIAMLIFYVRKAVIAVREKTGVGTRRKTSRRRK